MAYDIIVLAGQSNAQGSGCGNEELAYQPNDTILELVDLQRSVYERDEQSGKDVLTTKEPWNLTIRPASDIFDTRKQMFYTGFALYFAQEYVNSGLLKKGRKLLIVKAAVGGTGFARPEWGEGNVLERRLFDMLDMSLQGEDNKIVAVLWHQGEHDTVENPQFSVAEREEYYYGKLSSFVQRLRAKYSIEKVPFIAGEFVHHWWDENAEHGNAVLRATKKVCQDVGCADVASSEGLLSNAQATGDEDNIHFCRKSCVELGHRYFEKFLALASQDN